MPASLRIKSIPRLLSNSQQSLGLHHLLSLLPYLQPIGPASGSVRDLLTAEEMLIRIAGPSSSLPPLYSLSTSSTTSLEATTLELLQQMNETRDERGRSKLLTILFRVLLATVAWNLNVLSGVALASMLNVIAPYIFFYFGTAASAASLAMGLFWLYSRSTSTAPLRSRGLQNRTVIPLIKLFPLRACVYANYK